MVHRSYKREIVLYQAGTQHPTTRN
jgi:hypothetical protein